MSHIEAHSNIGESSGMQQVERPDPKPGHRQVLVKVVACSSLHPMMRVFPPLHYGEFYESDLDPALLTSAVQA